MENTGPFQLDPEFMRRLDSIDCSGPSVEDVLKKIEKFDLSFMEEDIVFPPKSSANVA